MIGRRGLLRALLVIYRGGVARCGDGNFRGGLLTQLVSYCWIWPIAIGINAEGVLLRGVVDAHGRGIHREGLIFSWEVLRDGGHIRVRKV